MKSIIGAAWIMCPLLVAGCHSANEVVEVQLPRVSVTVTRLQHLGTGEGHYHVWASFLQFDKRSGDSPTHTGPFESLGTFNVAAGDSTTYAADGSPARFTIPEGENAQLLDDVVVTIDRDTDIPDVSLTGSILIGGKFHGDATVALADLDVSYIDAFRSDFSAVSGKYTIVAPTSPADSNSGIWFVERQGTTTIAGLRNLPALPSGWMYEGWIGNYLTPEPGPGFFTYFSTGRFLRADSADFDGAGTGRGPGAGFNFPGQDFINSTGPGTPVRPDLRLFVFMVTIEPDPDNSPRPFSLALLSTPLPATPLPQGQTLLMNNVSSSSFPQGRVRIVRSGY